ncbi:hypothetical protein AJ80_00951 [Polytolypa hystricis UAMH7299]|uniref:Disintegrin and metalloproteinase domain-containing protein B n=1 Tax=Polytolypa hystricis (strain UAMH7299) TaxID=1447883 RepID=A0A2B7Z2E5_POLH7|nr:hypothetical protein AJ80_00951 [Polytolypa hystricis UAMH7299]
MRILRCLVPVIASALTFLSSNVHVSVVTDTPSTAHSSAPDRINYLSLVEQPKIHTPSRRVHAYSRFDITFNLHQKKQRIKLTLEPNHDILGEDTQITILGSDGSTRPGGSIDRRSQRIYKGWSWVDEEDGSWNRAGWARIVIKDDGLYPLFEGVFTIHNDHHHVMLRSHYMKTKNEEDPHLDDTNQEYMVVFRDSDMKRDMLAARSEPVARSCGSDNLEFNTDPNHPIFNQQQLRPDTTPWGSISLDSIFGITKRQDDMANWNGNDGSAGGNLRSSIGKTAGCPDRRKIALIGVAADCTYKAVFNSTEAARDNIISVVNSASELFEQTFNISLGLRSLFVPDGDCPGSPQASTPWNVPCGGNGDTTQPTINQRLNLFSAWRGKQDDNNAYWTLMTNCRTGAEVGLAWLGQLCRSHVIGNPDPNDSSSSAVSGANVVAITTNEWQVFAHETGHTFGAIHDCDTDGCKRGHDKDSTCCPVSETSCNAGGKFIMNPTSGDGITQFSACTVGNICSAMARNSIQTDCLSDNRRIPEIINGECGNGIVEEGEDCDCGGDETCKNNPCCDGATCKFIGDAVCDDYNEDCCSNCQFASATVVCRAGSGPCDPQEKCTGNSSSCPTDVMLPSGELCGDGLACASGQCTSRDAQCKSQMSEILGKDVRDCPLRNECTLMCQTPGMDGCRGIMQYFLDGTPCSSGGKCRNGVCQGGSALKAFTEWVNNNKPVAIGVFTAAGVILLILITTCVVRCCKRPRNRKMAPMRPGMPMGPAPMMPMPSPPQQQQQQPRGWSVPPIPHRWNDNNSNNAMAGGVPYYPPPAYGSTVAAQGRMPSMRYA